MKSFTFLITLLFLHTSCSDPKIDQDAESQKLMELSRQWAKDVQTDDNEAVLNYWAEDALVMIPGLPRFRGHDAIRKMLDDTSEMPGFEIN